MIPLDFLLHWLIGLLAIALLGGGIYIPITELVVLHPARHMGLWSAMLNLPRLLYHSAFLYLILALQVLPEAVTKRL